MKKSKRKPLWYKVLQCVIHQGSKQDVAITRGTYKQEYVDMKVEIENEEDVKLKAKNMEIGQVGKVIDSGYNGTIILCHYKLNPIGDIDEKSFVALSNPQVTWRSDCSLEVKILPPGTKITLTLEE